MATPLGDFVRSRRDALQPEAVGITTAPRRRVPGLRRAELAERAGISVEYLIRIEQGADRNPSPSVLDALAAALDLGTDDRERLRHLATISDECAAPRPASGDVPRDVRPGARALLDQLEPAPAIITNRLGDLFAHTDGFALVAAPSGLLDSAAPNLTRFVFTDARAREAFPDWEAVADERAGEVWIERAAGPAVAFSKEMSQIAGAAFTQRLRRHATLAAVLRWRHPEAGELRFTRETLELPADDGQQLVVFQPADEATAAALAALAARTQPLRMVG